MTTPRGITLQQVPALISAYGYGDAFGGIDFGGSLSQVGGGLGTIGGIGGGLGGIGGGLGGIGSGLGLPLGLLTMR